MKKKLNCATFLHLESSKTSCFSPLPPKFLLDLHLGRPGCSKQTSSSSTVGVLCLPQQLQIIILVFLFFFCYILKVF